MILIPKIFHQIWIGNRPLPEKFRIFQHTWRNIHPNWELKMWNEESIRNIKGFKISDLNFCKNYAEKSDLIRFFILQEYGGIYIDTDFECLKNIEPLLNNIECFLAKEKSILSGGITNSIIGATPNHPFIKKICSSLPGRIKETKNWGKYRSCDKIGPYFIQKQFNNFSERRNIKVFESEYFLPIESIYSTGGKLHIHKSIETSYAIHHYASSWISPISKIRKYIWNLPFMGKKIYFLIEGLINLIGIKKWKIFNHKN